MTTIRLVLEALTPIAHFDTRTGIDNATNIRLAMTQPVLLGGRRAYAPHVSENMLRTVCVRSPLADDLIDRLDVAGSVPRAVLNLLYSGGAMGGGRAPGDEALIGHAIGRLYPAWELLGGAIDSMILPRGKLRLSAWLVASEYRPALEHLFPEELDAAGTSAFDLVGEETRTRGTGNEASGNQSLYSYQLLAAGTRIAVELVLDPWTSAAAAGAVTHAFGRWDGFLGGQGRQGRGRVRIAWSDRMPDTDAYLAHVAANYAAMRDGLVDGSLGQGKPLCVG